MLLKFSWPYESNEVVCLTLDAAQEKFPDCFEDPEWVRHYCHAQTDFLLSHLKEAHNGDSFYADWCKVVVLHGGKEERQ